MDKFIILYTKRLYGAIVGTESGEVLSISKEQLNNKEWIENHASVKLNIFRISDSNLTSVPKSNTDLLISDELKGIESDFSLSAYQIYTSHFAVNFNGGFSQKLNKWVIEEEPVSILPL